MKQCITEKQYESLTNKARNSLNKWTIDKGYAINTSPEVGGFGYQFELNEETQTWYDYTCLSIGQMIEFLVDKKKDIHIERYDGGKRYSHWSVSTCYDEDWKFGKEKKELCDVLWEAVKNELERKV